MTNAVAPAAAIKSNLRKAKRYARRFKECQKWSPAKVKRMTVGQGGTFVLRIYKGKKFGKSGCVVYVEKVLGKLAKAQELYNKHKGRRDWGPKKRKELQNSYAAAEKYVYRKLGLPQEEEAQAKMSAQRLAAAKVAAGTGQALNAEIRAGIIANIHNTAGASTSPNITSMSDEELLAYEEEVENYADEEELGPEGPDFSIDGITDFVTENPLLAAGTGVLVVGLGWWATNQWMK
jgi:hypothetical protein